MFDFDNWGEYGIDDLLYDSRERIKELEDAVNSGKEFDTDWHGFSKNSETMRIYKTPENITVWVGNSISDALESTDLFNSFATEEELNMLTDEKLESIRNILLENGFEEEVTINSRIAAGSSVKDIIDEAVRLSIDCDKRLNESYNQCQIVTYKVLYNNPDWIELMQ